VEYSVLLIMAPDAEADGTAPDADADGFVDADAEGNAVGVLTAGDDGADELTVGAVLPVACFCGEELPFRSKPR
jgi:hypothetical protein